MTEASLLWLQLGGGPIMKVQAWSPASLPEHATPLKCISCSDIPGPKVESDKAMLPEEKKKRTQPWSGI